MNSRITTLPQSRVKLHIGLSEDELAKYYDAALHTLAKNVRLPGFRPGKAPSHLIENHIGKDQIRLEAIEQAIPPSYYEAITEHHIHPLHQPEVSIEKATDGLSYVAEADVLPEITLKDWRKIRVKPIAPEPVKQEDITRVIEGLRKQRANLTDVERGAEMGDFATISFVGSVDGVEREDMASRNHPILLGEGKLIPGFEEHIVGLKQGEETTFDIIFPKDYTARGTNSLGIQHQKSLAKKKATFQVTLDQLKGLDLPPLDDALAKEFGQESFAALESVVKDQLEGEATTDAQHKTEELVLQELLKRTKAVLPQVLIEDETDRIIQAVQDRLGLDATNFGMYLEKEQKTLDQYRTEIKPQAEKNALIGLALSEIMKEEKIDPEQKTSVREALDLLLKHATSH